MGVKRGRKPKEPEKVEDPELSEDIVESEDLEESNEPEAAASDEDEIPKESLKKPPYPYQYLTERIKRSDYEKKEIPVGKEDCLKGLTFVLTGQLISMRYTKAVEYIQSYGGRVTLSPSMKTSYLICGQIPGLYKKECAQRCRVPIINEDKFLDLIRTRSADDFVEKVKKPRKKRKGY